MLLQKISHCFPGVKYCMFKSYCSTMYCSPMWFECSTVTLKKKLKIAFNNSLRRLLFLTKYDYDYDYDYDYEIDLFGHIILRKYITMKSIIYKI